MSASGPTKMSKPGSRYFSNALERRVRDLEPDDVRRVVAQPLEHGRRDRVPGRRRELVDVERQRRARGRGGEEVRVLRLLVELEVRRADDDDRIGADLGRVRRERHRVRGRLGAAVDGDLEPLVRRLQEEIGDAAALLDAEQDPLPGRPEREDPVEPGSRTKKSTSGPNASSSSALPCSRSGVIEAASAPFSMAGL